MEIQYIYRPNDGGSGRKATTTFLSIMATDPV